MITYHWLIASNPTTIYSVAITCNLIILLRSLWLWSLAFKKPSWTNFHTCIRPNKQSCFGKKLPECTQYTGAVLIIDACTQWCNSVCPMRFLRAYKLGPIRSFSLICYQWVSYYSNNNPEIAVVQCKGVLKGQVNVEVTGSFDTNYCLKLYLLHQRLS